MWVWKQDYFIPSNHRSNTDNSYWKLPAHLNFFGYIHATFLLFKVFFNILFSMISFTFLISVKIWITWLIVSLHTRIGCKAWPSGGGGILSKSYRIGYSVLDQHRIPPPPEFFYGGLRDFGSGLTYEYPSHGGLLDLSSKRIPPSPQIGTSYGGLTYFGYEITPPPPKKKPSKLELLIENFVPWNGVWRLSLVSPEDVVSLKL